MSQLSFLVDIVMFGSLLKACCIFPVKMTLAFSQTKQDEN